MVFGNKHWPYADHSSSSARVGKNSEGALYFDGAAETAKADDRVGPSTTFT